MNILYFVNHFPKLSESFVINEIYELERRGHDVAVFSLKQPEEKIHHEEVKKIDAEIGYVDSPSLSAGLSSLGSWCIDPSVLKKAAHLSGLKEHAGATYIAGQCLLFIDSIEMNPDHIHGHFLNWPKLAMTYVAARLDIPCTATGHAYDLFSSGQKSVLPTLCDRLNRIVTISDYNRTYLKREISTTTPIDVSHMGIDPSKFTPTGTTIDGRILSVGRFVEKKGFEDAIRGVGKAIKNGAEVKYHIIGSGNRRSRIEGLIQECGISDSVEILGNVSDDQLITELDEAEIFLLPCRIASNGDRDGIPVALMEAMAMEIVPVSTTVSGIPELIVDGESGLLCEPGDVDCLSSSIERVVSDSSFRDRLASNARLVVESDFNCRHETGSLIESFESAAIGYE